MMASTFSSSMSCLAIEMALSGLLAESLTISSILRPFTPPPALSLSTNILAVLASGAPRLEAGPVTAKMAPTLIGGASACFLQPAKATASPTASTVRMFANRIIMVVFPRLGVPVSC